jgi:hypothetical protein
MQMGTKTVPLLIVKRGWMTPKKRLSSLIEIISLR